MRIYYLNDEQREMRVRILDASYDPVTCTGDTYVTLQPCEGRLFHVMLPADSVIYVKKWPNLVMISYIDRAAVAQLEQSQPSQVTE